MIFPQLKRFEDAMEKTGPQEMYIPPSMLSTKGTKIVDSWSTLDSPRLDHSLILKDGFLIPCKKSWLENLSQIHPPNMDAIKPKLPSYSFPKDRRESQKTQINTIPGPIYNIPSTIGSDQKKGASFGIGEKISVVASVDTAGSNATVLSLEKAKLSEIATKKIVPIYTFGIKTKLPEASTTNTPGPGSYSVIRDTISSLPCGIKYSAQITKKTKRDDDFRGPGPGEYNVIPSLVRQSFNRKIFRPMLPGFTERNVDVQMHEVTQISPEQRQQKINIQRPPDSPPRREAIYNRPGGVNRVRMVEDNSIEGYVKRQVLHSQRKIAASMLRSLVTRNKLQLSLPVVKILNALQQVPIFKNLSVAQLHQLVYILREQDFKSGEYIIKQGDIGDTFYILIDGSCICTINQPDGSEKFVFEPKVYDYFGEKALIQKAPRAANVIATTDCKVLFVGKSSFEVVFGSLNEIIEADAKKREENSISFTKETTAPIKQVTEDTIEVKSISSYSSNFKDDVDDDDYSVDDTLHLPNLDITVEE